MVSLIELSEAPLDRRGLPTWSDEVEARVAVELSTRDVVAIVFPFNGERTIGLAGSRIIKGPVHTWRVRLLAVPASSYIAVSAWCCSQPDPALDDEWAATLQPSQEAAFSGVFATRADARKAVQHWAAQLDRAPEAGTPQDAPQAAGPGYQPGILQEEDVTDFLQEIERASPAPDGTDDGERGEVASRNEATNGT